VEVRARSSGSWSAAAASPATSQPACARSSAAKSTSTRTAREHAAPGSRSNGRQRQQMQANAVLSMRFDSSEIGTTMSRSCLRRTAVVVVPDSTRNPRRRIDMLHQAIRVGAFLLGVLFFLAGMVLPQRRRRRRVSGLWSIAIGAGLMIAALLQRSGYRSEAAERDNSTPGPGGGESGLHRPSLHADQRGLHRPYQPFPDAGFTRTLAPAERRTGRRASRRNGLGRGLRRETAAVPGRRALAKLRRLSRMGRCTCASQPQR